MNIRVTSHITYMNWVMSHIWIYVWQVILHIWIESCHINELSHVTHMNIRVTYHITSCHTYEWVVSFIWMSHVTHVNKSCHTYVNESCHTHDEIVFRERMGHVTRMNKSYIYMIPCAIVTVHCNRRMCCSVLQCVAVCCSAVRCVAVCCSALQCAAVCSSVLQYVAMCYNVL